MKGASRYCMYCKRMTPVMFCEGCEYCMYCQKEYENIVEEESEEEDNGHREFE